MTKQTRYIAPTTMTEALTALIEKRDATNVQGAHA
jgi:hypothetical protein